MAGAGRSGLLISSCAVLISSSLLCLLFTLACLLADRCGVAVSRSTTMEGMRVAGEREMANPAAQVAEQGVAVEAAKEVVETADDAGKQVLGTEATVPGESERRQLLAPAPAAAALSGRKRRRDPDPEPEAEGTRQAADRLLSATPVQVQQPSAAPARLPLQRLLDACRAVFGVVDAQPMTAVVPYIRGIMDTIGPHDVGLKDDLRYFNRMNTRGLQNPPIITCKTIHECNNFTIAVFFLPLTAVMSLHDHPGMTVFSKLLIGSARLEAYDWVRPRVMNTMGPNMLAKKVQDHDVTPASPTWVLFPDGGGNLHRFTASDEGHCAFLDVLAPPYAPAEQRRCAYYRESSDERSVVRGGKTRRLVWLREVPMPRNMRIVNLEFRAGPLVV